jgi:DNA uptake protein ComE-like DNA-binding protein
MTFLRLLGVLLCAFALLAQPVKKGEGKKEAGSEKAAGLLDINSAPVDALKALPGIGDAYAAKIVKARPYRAKNELVTKGVIPEATYEKIKERIVARQKK